jgi:hypothetical protein
MQARFENRIAPLRAELDQVVAAIGAAETELASSAFAVAARSLTRPAPVKAAIRTALNSPRRRSAMR